MTTLLDVEKYPAKALLKLYQSRWMIEEDIRVKKCRSEIENFSGCSAQIIKQDIYAKVLFQNLVVALSHPVKRQIRSFGMRTKPRDAHQERRRKHLHQINRKETLSKLKDVVALLFLREDPVPFLSGLEKIWAKSKLPKRPGRHAPHRNRGRNWTKLQDHHFSFKRTA